MHPTEETQLWDAELMEILSSVQTYFRKLRVILRYYIKDLVFCWLFLLLSSSAKQATAATIVKRQTFMMKTNQMMYCSSYGIREVSVSQNKTAVKISTLETTNYVLRPRTATWACTYNRSGTPQPYQEYQLISCTLQIQPNHNRKSHPICRTLMSLGYPNDY